MNADSTAGEAKRERNLKILISAFIILHVTLTIAWLSPETHALRRAITDTTNWAWKFFGFWQGWELFAPAIRNVNAHSLAVINFDDGSSTAWPLPRFEQMGIVDKYRFDKFRKWNGDNAQWARYKEHWPALARYVANLHYAGTGPKPVSFTLLQFKASMPAPSSRVSREGMPQHDQAESTFFYTYKPEDFRK
jgi:hypothetical protein